MREVEVKFRVHAWFDLPDLADGVDGVAAVGPVERQELSASYVDTPDLRLARDGITFRRRVGDGQDGWQLKLPLPSAGDNARDELHDPSLADEAPPALRDLVTAWIRFAPLAPVATLVTDRQVVPLLDADGKPLAELVDDRVEVRENGDTVARFREIEVEDRGGGADVLGAVGDALVAAGAVGGEFIPKAIRALGPKASAPPDPPPPEPVSRRAPASAAVTAHLRRQVRALMAADVAVRRGDPDAVHRLRVVTRRLESGLKAFEPLLDPEWADGLRTELEWVAGQFSPARDADVLLARLRDDLARLDPADVRGNVASRIEEHLRGELAKLPETTTAVLGGQRYLALLQRLVDGATSPRVTERASGRCADVLPGLVKQAWRRLSRRAAILDPGAPDADYHRVRAATKHARYTVDATLPAFGKPARRLAAALAELQDILGEHKDAVNACAVLRELSAAPRSGSTSFTLGILYARERAAAQAARTEFAERWPELSRRGLRRWLAG